MSFVRKSISLSPLADTVFTTAAMAKADHDPYVYDATLGMLYDENGHLAAFHTVYDTLTSLPYTAQARYAESFKGNADYRKQVFSWVCQDKVRLPHTVIASCGGSGAVYMTMRATLDTHETILIPEIAWGAYALMAQANQYLFKTYSLFDGSHFHLQSLENEIKQLQAKQSHITIVINDPCHNPTGYSLSTAEWKALIIMLNRLSATTPITILNDIAYIDYSFNLAHSRDYMELLNHLSENVLFVIAFSCSKTMTAYGLRCGAAIAIAKRETDIQDIEIVFEKIARATWSSIHTGVMDTFVRVTRDRQDSFLKEKNFYIGLLRKRGKLFCTLADNAGLLYYPYHEGFFITLRCRDDAEVNNWYHALINRHIYTVPVHHGIRVALCSLPLAKIKDLPEKIKEEKPV